MSPAPGPLRRRLHQLCSLEGLLGLFGLFSLTTGLWQWHLLSIFWGGIILAGLWLLAHLRRRDWERHWQQLAAKGRPTEPANRD